MAKLNDVYVFVETEEIDHIVEVTSYAVEKGVDLTDHVNNKRSVVTLKGQIVGEDYMTTLSNIRKMQKNGTLIKYVGTEVFANMMITAFRRGRSNAIKGGCTFDMTLTGARIAKAQKKKKNTSSKTKAKTNGGTKQKTTNSKKKYVYHTVRKGDTVYALLKGPYKSLGSTAKQIMDWNPHAFSKKGDFKTLQIGKKLKMGVRK